MAMAFRVRRLKEAYRLLPLLSAGNRCNLLINDNIFLPPRLNYLKNSHADINTRCSYRCHQDHRYATISEAVSEPLVQFDSPPSLSLLLMSLKIACEACYVLFNGSKSSSICYGKEANIMILDKAIKDFRAQESETPKFMHNLTSTWVKPTDDFKEPPLCFPLRNLLLYFPDSFCLLLLLCKMTENQTREEQLSI